MEVVKVMVDSGIYEWDRTNGDHAILRWEPPADHDSDARTVPVPLHDELSPGTLRDIASQAGAKDFDEFRAWIERNRRPSGDRSMCGRQTDQNESTTGIPTVP